MAEGQEAVTRRTRTLQGDEATTLLETLDRVRAIVEWKCAQLDAAGLQARLGGSAITLGGLLKHLAHVEDDMVDRWFLGRDLPAPWDAIDWDENPDWDWRSAADDTPEELLALWRDRVARADSVFRQAIAQAGLHQLGAIKSRSGESPNLRFILLTLIEEYARHAGHADLVRESVDGRVGEDPPGW